jgi:hypothetical protein
MQHLLFVSLTVLLCAGACEAIQGKFTPGKHLSQHPW